MLTLWTKSNYSLHVKAALSDTAEAHHCGVKRQCPISDRWSYFHATSGYSPEALHELLEGIVPFELALCLEVFIKRKYFSLQESFHLSIPYKWSDTKKTKKKLSTKYSLDFCIT